MAEPFPRAHFLLALFAGALSFLVVVPLAMAYVLGDWIHAYDKQWLALFDFTCSLLVVYLVYGSCQRWWRGEPRRERWRKAMTALAAMLLAPVLAIALLVGVLYLLVFALG